MDWRAAGQSQIFKFEELRDQDVSITRRGRRSRHANNSVEKPDTLRGWCGGTVVVPIRLTVSQVPDSKSGCSTVP
jgi:hypothetical protein